MKKTEMVSYAVRNMRHTKIRSWLTMIGIFIGIMSIVVLIGLADGLKNEIGSELDKFGSRTIVVIPIDMSSAGLSSAVASGFTASSGKLFEKDYSKLEGIAGIEYISKVVNGRLNVEYKDQESTVTVFGVEPNVFKQTVGLLEIEKGRFLDDNDYGTAVVGYDVADDGFDKKIEVNSQLKMGDKTFRVVGVMKKAGTSFFNPDNVIYINFKDAEQLYDDQLAEGEISTIRITVGEEENVDEIAEEITDALLSLHKVKEEEKDFSVITSSFINGQIETITGALTLFLVIVSGVSLVVGGIGISNTMFMNVVERTREIGILKSIGATRDDIVSLFIIEASVLGTFGGLLGIIIGGIVLFLISLVAGINASFSWPVAIVAILFSGVVGIISGAIPAKNASEISPLEALRYE